MEPELSNVVTALGNYNGVSTSISSEANLVTMIGGLTIVKNADKTVWADGTLTYTITINNQTSVAYTTPVITDVLDGNLVTFVNDSVTIDGAKAESSQYNYDTSTNTLTVTLEDLASSSSKAITFQVTKKA